MSGLDQSALAPFLRLARLLDRGLFADRPSDAFQALVPRTDNDWEDLFVSARNNQALAPLCYIFAAKPAFGALAGEEELLAMREWHDALAFRSGEIRTQITELADLFAQNDKRIILLKGAARLFDDLYPDISCRFSVDIDPLIDDPAMFYRTFALGYSPLDDASYDMKAIRNGDISAATGPTFHHLPPLYREGDQVTVELHIRPFAPKFDHLGIPGLWQDASAIAGRPALLVPSVPHQIIINIIHTLLHGLAKEQFSLSVRDLFEGHALYMKANEDQREQVRAHFSEAGYSKDFELWRSVCFQVFENPLYQGREVGFHKRFFARLVTTQLDPKARFRLRLISKVKEFLFLEIWNWPRLKMRLRHFMSAAFWQRAKTQFRLSRQKRN